MMIACIRVRFDATQNTRGELVAQEDLDHLVILEMLSSYVDPNSLKFFQKIALTLQETMGSTFNTTRLQAIGRVMAEAEVLAKGITVLNEDL